MAQKNQTTTIPGAGQAEAAQAQEQELHPLLKWAHENYRLLASVLSVVMLIMAAYSGYTYYKDYQWDKAKAELSSIMVNTTGMERVNALQEFLAGAPKAMKPAVRIELALTYDRNERFNDAAEAWKEVAAMDDGPLRMTSPLARARALKSAGKSEEAVGQYQALLTSAPEAYQQNVLRQLALAAEEAKMWDTAIDAYGKLINDSQTKDTIFFKEKMKMLQALQQG